MENRKPLTIVLINILIGVSWALTALGAIIVYSHYQNLGFLPAIILSFFGMSIGFVFVVFFEMCLVQFEKLNEARKQTKLLQEIKEKLDTNNNTTDNTLEIDIDKLSNN